MPCEEYHFAPFILYYVRMSHLHPLAKILILAITNHQKIRLTCITVAATATYVRTYVAMYVHMYVKLKASISNKLPTYVRRLPYQYAICIYVRT